MSMSTHIVGFQQADEKWKEMKRVWDSCESAKIEVPKEVRKFFGDESPGDKPGREVEIKEALTVWGDNYRDGWELDISKLPPHVTKIRFYNAY